MIGLNSIGIWLTTGLQAEPATAPVRPGTESPGEANSPPMTDIHDIKPLMDMGGDGVWLLYLAGGAALLLLSGLIWWLWKRRQRAGAPAPIEMPEIPPDEEAHAALNALASEAGLAPKLFYFRLSAILRRYVERRFRFPAAEMTTEELFPCVDRLNLSHTLKLRLKAFCKEADPIKFAGATAGQEQAERNLVFCREFIHGTTEEPEPDAK